MQFVRGWIIFAVFNLIPNAGLAEIDWAVGPLSNRGGEFKVLNIENTPLATCDMFDAFGEKTKTKSEKAPGCVVQLESIKEKSHAEHYDLGIFYAYSTGKYCKQKIGAHININVTAYRCYRPYPGLTKNTNYCDIDDFNNPKKIKDEQWACMLEKRPWLIKK